ncbi:adenine-specific methyltransferase EcoRI family protein [Bifidobacterium sp. SO1]|uniref:adenine-specific methyltransferase EcoRI family protein n=1 Tax=Bifidobacterium sp. SO1 TaxID=2809029 RepID=UPI001BDDC7BA|nr:adenine-specific methyltransferase EcoRI family protein [Bifidobacterium sp. SO1]MBT1162182.1 hypothetical protein [Bifidobacterium sp. SO1]
MESHGYRYELINDGRTTPYTVEDFQITELAGTGGFETPECQPLLDIPDVIVCTNPPFSRVKDLLPMLDQHGTSFLILAHMNAVTYNSVFPIVLEGRCWFGLSIHSGDRPFLIPDDYPHVSNNLILDQQGRTYAKVTGVRWLTNLPAGLADKTDRIADYRIYTPEEYPTYDSYDAIEVSKVRDIPTDYTGLMGVPVTFLDHWSLHSRSRLVGQLNHGTDPRYDPAKPVIDGHVKYKRLLIQSKGQTS